MKRTISATAIIVLIISMVTILVSCNTQSTTVVYEMVSIEKVADEKEENFLYSNFDYFYLELSSTSATVNYSVNVDSLPQKEGEPQQDWSHLVSFEENVKVKYDDKTKIFALQSGCMQGDIVVNNGYMESIVSIHNSSYKIILTQN